MLAIPEFRFALFTDLHIGATRANVWHNHFLIDQPAATVEATVAAVNAERPDFAVVLGDLSDDGTEEQLLLARAALDRLSPPWIVCQGNHDVVDERDASEFERAFGDRAPVGVVPPASLPLPDGVVATAFTARFGRVDGQWRASANEEEFRSALVRVSELRPELLLVFWHFPLLRQSGHVNAFGGKNAGTLWDGERLLIELASLARVTVVFTGHQHFHHIAASSDHPRWLHCTTASLAEYPAEFRVVSAGPEGVSIHTASGAAEIVTASSPPAVTWVAGRPEDREFTWAW